MDVDPARAYIIAGNIDNLGAGFGVARTDMLYLAARDMNVPELSSRLQFIRYEVDAREEVDDIGADR